MANKMGRVCKFCLGKRSHGLSDKAIRNCGLLKADRRERVQRRVSKQMARKAGRWVKQPTLASRAWQSVNRR